MEKENKNIFERLAIIQAKLKAPKDQYNSFGKYKYRSAEGILEAVKPILREQDCLLWITDEIVEVGGRVYVKATACFTCCDTSGLAGPLQVSAYARESDTKAGMDCSQITGAASSYARKYALNGLFAIDDTKDADALNTSPEYTSTSRDKGNSKPVIKEGQPNWQSAIDYCRQHGCGAETLREWYTITDKDIARINNIVNE